MSIRFDGRVAIVTGARRPQIFRRDIRLRDGVAFATRMQEITIDESLVHGIVTEEVQRARAEIDDHGPIAAYESSRRRHDARLSAAPDVHTLACKSGCYWCC